MKISLMTVPRIKNYGAVLMCYATQTLFEEHGFEAEFADFLRLTPREADNFRQFYSNLTVKESKNVILRAAYTLLEFRTIHKRAEVFGGFVKRYLKLSDIHYSNNEKMIMDNPPEADVYCTGGDQMWNEMYNFHRIIKPFYLEHAPEGKARVSFSTSLGNSDFDEQEKHDVRPLLEKYTKISVREASGKKAIEQLGLENVYHIQDPTLIFHREQWEALAAPRMIKKPYILVYQLKKNKSFDMQAKKLAKQTGYKLVRLEYSYYKCYMKKGKSVILPSPEEFVSLIRHAECIITDSFHGTAFSLNLNKPFITVYPAQTSTRIESLLTLCGILDRNYSQGNMYDIYSKQINYEKVNDILDKERVKAHEFIDSIKVLAGTSGNL